MYLTKLRIIGFENSILSSPMPSAPISPPTPAPPPRTRKEELDRTRKEELDRRTQIGEYIKSERLKSDKVEENPVSF